MRFQACLFVALAAALSLPPLAGQGTTARETQIHKNVLLTIQPFPTALEKEFRDEFNRFVPLFEEVLRELTADQVPECALTVRVEPGAKEIGLDKVVKRTIAHVTVFRRNSDRSFLGSLLLYSYANAGPVTKEEVSTFLKRRIPGTERCKGKLD